METPLNSTITFSLPNEWKEKLNVLAHERSVKTKRKITNGGLIRDALVTVYKLDQKNHLSEQFTDKRRKQ